jgi:hypothetical protein
VVDGDGATSHVSIFNVDGDGGFALKGVATLKNVGAANGVAIIHSDLRFNY